jgi:hypothetical protein
VGAKRGGASVGVPAQLRRTSRGAAMWVRSAGEFLWVFLLNFAGPAEGRRCGCAARGGFYQRRHWSPSTTLRRGGARPPGRLRRCCEGIPGCAQANRMGSFSGQHLDLDVTRGAPLFQDAVRALVGAAQEAAGVRGQDLPPPGQASGAARTRRGRSAPARSASCCQ